MYTLNRYHDIQPLKISGDKIGSSRQPLERFYILFKLEEVDKTKYLGITINADSSWISQVEYATGKSDRVLDILRRNWKECQKDLKEISYYYFSMVSSLPEYASAVRDPYLKKNTIII